MKSPDDAHFQQWAENPEPSIAEPDASIVLDTDMTTADAYLWESRNCQEGWLAYHGNMADLRR